VGGGGGWVGGFLSCGGGDLRVALWGGGRVCLWGGGGVSRGDGGLPFSFEKI